MNKSTIIMPCNNTGYTDPSTTLGWGIVDFDWSNGKGTGTADGWVKHSPMDDEEMLYKQVQMTAAARFRARDRFRARARALSASLSWLSARTVAERRA